MPKGWRRAHLGQWEVERWPADVPIYCVWHPRPAPVDGFCFWFVPEVMHRAMEAVTLRRGYSARPDRIAAIALFLRDRRESAAFYLAAGDRAFADAVEAHANSRP